MSSGGGVPALFWHAWSFCVIDVKYPEEPSGFSRQAYPSTGWRKARKKELAASLTDEFGRCFSRSNLQNMRKFYLTYRDRLPEKCQMPSGKLASEQKSQTPSGEFTKVLVIQPSALNGKPTDMNSDLTYTEAQRFQLWAMMPAGFFQLL
jgi:hypothetical protein